MKHRDEKLYRLDIANTMDTRAYVLLECLTVVHHIGLLQLDY